MKSMMTIVTICLAASVAFAQSDLDSCGSGSTSSLPITCSELGVRLIMPELQIREGDNYWCHVWICNPTAESYERLALFVAMDIAGAIYFWPDFSSFDYREVSVQANDALRLIIVPSFCWTGMDTGLIRSATWTAAMLSGDLDHIVGEISVAEISWD